MGEPVVEVAWASHGYRRPLLSVVIPAYNIEPYIGHCVRSVMTDAARGRVEIVVVDDDAADATQHAAVSALREKGWPDGIVMKHARNAGLGFARRTGFGAATGRYVWFLDGDDLVEEASFCELLGFLESQRPADVLMLRRYLLADESGVLNGASRVAVKRRFLDAAGRRFAGHRYVSAVLVGSASPNITNKIFPRTALRLEDLSSWRIWEDVPSVLAIFGRDVSVSVVDLDLYIIRERMGSIQRSDSALSSDLVEFARSVLGTLDRRTSSRNLECESAAFFLGAGVYAELENYALFSTPAAVLRRARVLRGEVRVSDVWRSVRAGGVKAGGFGLLLKVSPRLAVRILQRRTTSRRRWLESGAGARE